MNCFPKTCRQRTKKVLYDELEHRMDAVERLLNILPPPASDENLADSLQRLNQGLKSVLTVAQECFARGYLKPCQKIKA
jgi:hypothetical protein